MVGAGPANRYQSAAEMRTDLGRVLSGQRPSAPMVMTEQDRTAVLGAGRQQAMRGRHRPEAFADHYDPNADKEPERWPGAGGAATNVMSN